MHAAGQGGSNAGMDSAVASFLVQSVGLSMSGVLSPGPVTAATMSAGSRRADAGAWIAVGHGVIEFPLMGLILLGAGAWLASRPFQIAVGWAGGAVLVGMAVMMFLSLPKPPADQKPVARVDRPLLTGVILTAGNPYFLLWWATVGLALATQAAKLGVLAFVLFAVVHWACDLIWLSVLSVASFKGIGLMGARAQRAVTIVCAAAMVVFGGKFILGAMSI